MIDSVATIPRQVRLSPFLISRIAFSSSPKAEGITKSLTHIKNYSDVIKCDNKTMKKKEKKKNFLKWTFYNVEEGNLITMVEWKWFYTDVDECICIFSYVSWRQLHHLDRSSEFLCSEHFFILLYYTLRYKYIELQSLSLFSSFKKFKKKNP